MTSVSRRSIITQKTIAYLIGGLVFAMIVLPNLLQKNYPNPGAVGVHLFASKEIMDLRRGGASNEEIRYWLKVEKHTKVKPSEMPFYIRRAALILHTDTLRSQRKNGASIDALAAWIKNEENISIPNIEIRKLVCPSNVPLYEQAADCKD